jgi:hypothetical protein
MGVTISLPMAQERTAHSPNFCETEFLFQMFLILPHQPWLTEYARTWAIVISTFIINNVAKIWNSEIHKYRALGGQSFPAMSPRREILA